MQKNAVLNILMDFQLPYLAALEAAYPPPPSPVPPRVPPAPSPAPPIPCTPVDFVSHQICGIV